MILTYTGIWLYINCSIDYITGHCNFFFLSFFFPRSTRRRCCCCCFFFLRIPPPPYYSQLDAIQQAIATRVVLPVIDTNDFRISQQDMFAWRDTLQEMSVSTNHWRGRRLLPSEYLLIFPSGNGCLLIDNSGNTRRSGGQHSEGGVGEKKQSSHPRG